MSPIRLEPTIEDSAALATALRVNDAAKSDQLLRGFYELQSGSWRWTMPQFAVALGTPAGAAKRGARLLLDFDLPDASIATLKNVTIAVKINDVPLEPETFTTPGQHEYQREVPASAFAKQEATVEFSVDKFLTPPNDRREPGPDCDRRRPGAQMTRVARGAYWVAPMAFCLALYWLGLKAWFSEDDFAWLNLRNHVIDFHAFLWAMFAPLAQGTIRPLSERGFFMVFTYFFHLHPLPYHIFVFLNQFLNIALLVLIARKLTNSDLAGFLAPVLWLANVAQVTPLAWTSAYNEVQCASFILASFYLFLRYAETGRSSFYWAQWATFLLGFGANEINVVYPALAALYAILFARRYWLSTLPMFGVSAAYALLHRLASAGSGRVFTTTWIFTPAGWPGALWQYWRILLAVPEYVNFQHWQPLDR